MGTFQMSREERRRLVVLSQVEEGKISLVKAAELLRLSYRQMKRVWSRRQREGDGGVVHRLRGRRSNRQAQPGMKKRALRLYREKYRDYGITLAAECLAEEDGLAVPVSTLRRWLLGASLWERKRTRKPHRRRRARREHYGELVQMDGSYHDWFEGRRGWAMSMVMIDDATGRVFARFFENEFRDYVREHGLPRGLYVDQHGIYREDREANAQEILAGKEPRTQFGRAMVELGQCLLGEDVPVQVQRPFRGAGGEGGQCSSGSARREPIRSHQGQRPSAGHPWRKRLLGEGR